MRALTCAVLACSALTLALPAFSADPYLCLLNMKRLNGISATLDKYVKNGMLGPNEEKYYRASFAELKAIEERGSKDERSCELRSRAISSEFSRAAHASMTKGDDPTPLEACRAATTRGQKEVEDQWADGVKRGKTTTYWDYWSTEYLKLQNMQAVFRNPGRRGREAPDLGECQAIEKQIATMKGKLALYLK